LTPDVRLVLKATKGKDGSYIFLIMAAAEAFCESRSRALGTLLICVKKNLSDLDGHFYFVPIRG
jgi:hypothetical protein